MNHSSVQRIARMSSPQQTVGAPSVVWSTVHLVTESLSLQKTQHHRKLLFTTAEINLESSILPEHNGRLLFRNCGQRRRPLLLLVVFILQCPFDSDPTTK